MIRSIQTLILAVVLLAAASCTQAQSNNTLTAKAFATAIKDKSNLILLDVRTPAEYAEGHLEGSKNMDWLGDSFEAETAKLDKNKPVYVYCRSGKRSAEAAEALRQNGFAKVYELDGGIMSWEAAGQPVK